MPAAKHAKAQAEKEKKAPRNEDNNQAKAFYIACEKTRDAEMQKVLEH
jgi:hypothetical protein